MILYGFASKITTGGLKMDSKDGFKIGGYFDVTCYDADGNFKWAEYKHNVVTDEGIDHLLNVHFHAETQVDPWYVMLCGTGTKAITDTLASTGVWTEVTAYADERKAYVEAEATGKSITNSANKAVFTMNGDATVAGAGLTTVASGTIGTLFAVADFATERGTASGDTIQIGYTISCSDQA